MSNLPVVREENAFELGKVFAESGMFPNVRKAAEAVVKIIAGREFGLGPMAAMNGIHMVDGKPTLAANLIAGQIKRHPHYNYRVLRRDDTGCELEFSENGKWVGKMTWEKKDAQAAGLLGKNNWKKYPRDMYFARALTAGARTFCPDVLGGSPVYTAEELGAEDAPVSDPAAVRDHSSPFSEVGPRGEDLREPEPEEVTDAEIVPDEPQDNRVSQGVLDQLRAKYVEKGFTENELCWFLLSVGVENLPAEPSKADIGEAMRSLTLEQACRLDDAFDGRGEYAADDSVPGSGETA